MKFDTLDKKPKLYGLLIETCAALAAVAILAILGADRYIIPITVILTVLTLSAIVWLVAAFFGQIRYNPYSYNTIYYIGFSFYLLAVLVLEVLILMMMIRQPETRQFSKVLSTIIGSAQTFILLTFPFVLVFSVALCVSNITLILKEGLRFVNLLGIILAVLLVSGQVFLYLFDYYVSGSQFEVMLHDLVVHFFAAVYLYFECMVLGTIVANILVSRYEPEKDKDFLIILGCGLRKDGTPTPLLKGRADRALAFADAQEKQTGKALTFVVSGGQGPNEVISESASMKRYLLEQGVPEDRIIEEDRSSNTQENMAFSKQKIEEAGGGRTAFCTNGYHVFRSGLYARRVKMRAVGMGAKTKWYFWPNAAVREFVGLLTEHRGKQALVLGALIVFYAVLTVLAYR